MQLFGINFGGQSSETKKEEPKKTSYLDILKKPVNYLSDNPKTVVAVASLVTVAAVAYFYGPALMQKYDAYSSSFFAEAAQTKEVASIVETVKPETTKMVQEIVKKSIPVPTNGTSIRSALLGSELLPVAETSPMNRISPRPALLGSELLPTQEIPLQSPRNLLFDLATMFDSPRVWVPSYHVSKSDLHSPANILSALQKANRELQRYSFKDARTIVWQTLDPARSMIPQKGYPFSLEFLKRTGICPNPGVCA